MGIDGLISCSCTFATRPSYQIIPNISASFSDILCSSETVETSNLFLEGNQAELPDLLANNYNNCFTINLVSVESMRKTPLDIIDQPSWIFATIFSPIGE